MRASPFAAAFFLCAILGACASTPRTQPDQPRVSFPLPACSQSQTKDCIARLFQTGDDVAARTGATFPSRYLELDDGRVREDFCQGRGAREPPAQCAERLEAVKNYFFPGGKRPPEGSIGVALEGGGSKSAPFSLGVLAGLQEMGLLQDSVGAIASASGGSYAASYYFNRRYDAIRHPDRHPGRPEDWFRSCIPDQFAAAGYNGFFRDILAANPDLPLCGERRSPTVVPGRCNAFDPAYEFLGQVWTEPNLVMGNEVNALRSFNDGKVPPPTIWNTVGLLGESILAFPYTVLSRWVFRWPGNTSPSKLAYTNGIERAYGYSPYDWKSVESDPVAQVSGDLAHVWETHRHRLEERTMYALGEALDGRGPLWILGSSTPGAIGPMSWFGAESRDPVRHQFELTPGGYGSGIHGYANVAPIAGNGVLEPDLFDPVSYTGNSNLSMPIVEGVVASAAFFDDYQSIYNHQPERSAFGLVQRALDLEWYREIRNFNVGNGHRALQMVSPLPAYFAWTYRNGTEPYIHLQDGGNSENSAILALLRRGYRTIVYAHGTQDDMASFESICHLKNHLELDGSYTLTSPELDGIARRFSWFDRHAKGRGFGSYLDQLCTMQLDNSDLMAFDDNLSIKEPERRAPAVAKLLCGRLGYDTGTGPRNEPDPGYRPCPEFFDHFYPRNASGEFISVHYPESLPQTYAPIEDLFSRWGGSKLTFRIDRFDPRVPDAAQAAGANPLAVVIAVVPTVSYEEMSRQLEDWRPGDDTDAQPWAAFCRLSAEQRKAMKIASCSAPGHRSVGARGSQAGPALPCIAMAHILERGCSAQGHPSFPQDNFVFQTWYTNYTMYAAYFDLGRHLAWRAIEAVGGITDSHPQAPGTPRDTVPPGNMVSACADLPGRGEGARAQAP